MGKMVLDPNAASYSDDEIVGKVNAATAKVDSDQLQDGTVNKIYSDTEKAKLSGIDEGAKVDQDGDNIISAIDAGAASITREDALSQVDMKLVKSEPVVGEHRVNYIVRKADGKMEADFEDVAEV